MTLDSVVSPQVLNKYLIFVDIKSRRFKYQSGRVGDEAKKCKLVSHQKQESWHLSLDKPFELVQLKNFLGHCNGTL